MIKPLKNEFIKINNNLMKLWTLNNFRIATVLSKQNENKYLLLKFFEKLLCENVNIDYLFGLFKLNNENILNGNFMYFLIEYKFIKVIEYLQNKFNFNKNDIIENKDLINELNKLDLLNYKKIMDIFDIQIKLK